MNKETLKQKIAELYSDYEVGSELNKPFCSVYINEEKGIEAYTFKTDKGTYTTGRGGALKIDRLMKEIYAKD